MSIHSGILKIYHNHILKKFIILFIFYRKWGFFSKHETIHIFIPFLFLVNYFVLFFSYRSVRLEIQFLSTAAFSWISTPVFCVSIVFNALSVMILALIRASCIRHKQTSNRVFKTIIHYYIFLIFQLKLKIHPTQFIMTLYFVRTFERATSVY